jgi:very-short-patch-repair endonuclease
MEPYNRNLKPFARTLRTGMTEAEQHLWWRLRNKQVSGIQFYRQKPLLSYIVDFYSHKAKLVIELDGAQHLDAEYRIRDGERDAQLASIGLQVLRFDDRQVLLETDAVMEIIFRVVNERIK